MRFGSWLNMSVAIRFGSLIHLMILKWVFFESELDYDQKTDVGRLYSEGNCFVCVWEAVEQLHQRIATQAGTERFPILFNKDFSRTFF